MSKKIKDKTFLIQKCWIEKMWPKKLGRKFFGSKNIWVKRSFV